MQVVMGGGGEAETDIQTDRQNTKQINRQAEIERGRRERDREKQEDREKHKHRNRDREKESQSQRKGEKKRKTHGLRHTQKKTRRDTAIHLPGNSSPVSLKKSESSTQVPPAQYFHSPDPVSVSSLVIHAAVATPTT